MVTVYTKPRCVQCTATYRALDNHGIAYHSIDITEDTEAFDRLKALGHQSAPVVESPIGDWAGFQPDKITELKAHFAASTALG
jgi:glutaredoxin-like protein NrdH